MDAHRARKRGVGEASQRRSHAISFHCDKGGYISVRKALKGALPRPALPRIRLLSCPAAYLRDKQRARVRFLVDTVARTVINAIVAWKIDESAGGRAGLLARVRTRDHFLPSDFFAIRDVSVGYKPFSNRSISATRRCDTPSRVLSYATLVRGSAR